jgi:hypothetical protein
MVLEHHFSPLSIHIMELVGFASIVSELATLMEALQRLRRVMTLSHYPTCSSTFYAALFPGAS